MTKQKIFFSAVLILINKSIYSMGGFDFGLLSGDYPVSNLIQNSKIEELKDVKNEINHEKVISDQPELFWKKIKPAFYKRIPGDCDKTESGGQYFEDQDEYLDIIDGIFFSDNQTLIVEWFNKKQSIIHYWDINTSDNTLNFWDDMVACFDYDLLKEYTGEFRSFVEEGLYIAQSRNEENKKFFTANNKIYLKTSYKRFLDIYDAQNDKQICSFMFYGEIRNIAINKEGSLFAVSTGKNVYIFKSGLEIAKSLNFKI